MYKKGAGNDKQVKDAGNRTLCPYRNFSQAIKVVYFIKKRFDSVSMAFIKKGKFSGVLSEKRVLLRTIFSEERGLIFGPWMRMWPLFQMLAPAHAGQ